ncbi:MAG: alpha/beta fold hydrolase [Chloroflexi bacterium]|nr:alpha/beta fold hydrolase [Chloroflexota bacterium]
MAKATLILLHGALGSREQFSALAPFLQDRYDVHALNLEGHGGAALPERAFRIEHFVENVQSYITEHAIAPAHFFGYSLGGFVACALAKAQPELAHSIATLGTKFHWDAETATREVALLDPATIKTKIPKFAQALAERHGANWEAICWRTQDLLWSLAGRGGFAPQDAATIQQRVRVMLGDRDATVTLAESHAIFQALPRGEFEILPATPHPFEIVSPTRLAQSLLDFFG